MGLQIPVPGVDPGPDYAANVSGALTVVDQHNHTSGSGVLIPSAGLNINADIPFNSNNGTLFRSVRFAVQSAPLSLASDLACLYASGVDLYYNDLNGNQIRITQSGTVAGSAGTITGLPSGTASASYGGGTFVFQSATNTAANIDGGSYVLRNATANSRGLTLSPPSAMAANYTIVLPALSGSTGFITIDTSGNMGSSVPIAQGIVTSMIADANVTRPKLAAVGQQISASCGNFSTTSATPVNVTNLSVTITTSGRPVLIALQADGSSNFYQCEEGNGPSTDVIAYFRGATQIATHDVVVSDVTGPVPFPPSFIDVVTAGTYTYTVKVQTSGTLTFRFCVLVAYEL